MAPKHRFLLLILVFYSFPLFACEEIKAAFDIGSANTKMSVYAVNTCADQSIKQIENVKNISCEAQEEIRYKEDVEKHGSILPATLTKGIELLKKMKSLAQQCGATAFSGVATSAFRQASNVKEAEKSLNASGIHIQVITQAQEAALEFYGAISKTQNAEASSTCVWGIGGSSTQITCQDHGHLRSYMSKVASISFKNKLINTQQHSGIFSFFKQKTEKQSPNPIGLRDYKKASKILSREAKKILKTFPNQLSTKNIIGVGGVHYYSVSKALGQETYSEADLFDFIQTKLNKTDEQLGGGKYIDTSVSNVILVQQLMKALHIKQVQASKVNLTEGLVASPDYWN